MRVSSGLFSTLLIAMLVKDMSEQWRRIMSANQTSMPELPSGLERNGRTVDIPQLLGLIKNKFWILVVSVTISVALASFYLATASIKYEATMVIAEVQELSSTSALDSLASKVNPFSFGTTPGLPQRLGAVLTMEVVAQRLADKYGLLQRIFGSQWDEQTQSWKMPSSFTLKLLDTTIGSLGFPVWQPPSASHLAEEIRQSLSVETDRNTNFLTIRYEHTNPEFAKQMLGYLYAEADAVLRESERDANRARIEYTMRKLQQVTSIPQQAALTSLLTQLERQDIQLSAEQPYAARLVQPPITSPWPVSPRPLRTLAAAILLGLLVGSTIILQLFNSRLNRQ